MITICLFSLWIKLRAWWFVFKDGKKNIFQLNDDSCSESEVKEDDDLGTESSRSRHTLEMEQERILWISVSAEKFQDKFLSQDCDQGDQMSMWKMMPNNFGQN
jgi:hypothetical protein